MHDDDNPTRTDLIPAMIAAAVAARLEEAAWVAVEHETAAIRSPGDTSDAIRALITADEADALAAHTKSAVDRAVDAARAAGLEEAAGVADAHWQSIGGGMIYGPSDEAIIDTANAIAERIRALITKDEAEALAEVKRQARVEGMREALDVLDKLPEYGSPDVNIGVSNAWSAIAAMIAREGGE